MYKQTEKMEISGNYFIMMALKLFRVKSGKRNELLSLFGFALVTAIYASVKVFDSDLWWHLAGGRLIWESGIPKLNTFSHTYPDYPWSYTQWLFGAVVFAVERVGGLIAVEGFQVALIVTAFTLSLNTARRQLGKLPWFIILPVLLVALSASRQRFVPRPHLITFVGLALLISLWQRGAQRLFLWFGLIGLVWGNSHAGVGFGLIAIAAMALAALMEGKWMELRKALICGVAFFLGTLVNPNFFYPYIYSFSHLSVGNILPLFEFRHASPINEFTFFVWVALLVISLPMHIRKRKFLHPILAVAFFPLALDAIRVIPKLILVTLPGVTVSAVQAGEWFSMKRWRRVVGTIVLTVFSAVAILLSIRDYNNDRQLFPGGWGKDSRLFPEGAADFVQRVGLKGRLFNDFDYGGYLAWRLFPDSLVFQDGRVQTYPPEFFQDFYSKHGQEHWVRMMQKYNVDYAIVARRPYSGDIDVGMLFDSMGWPMVYMDGNAYIYVKPGTPNAVKTSAWAFRLIRGGDSAETLFAQAEKNPQIILGELRRIDPSGLLTAYDFYRFGAAAFAASDNALAETFLRTGLQMFPESQEIRMNLGFLLMQTNRRNEARKELTLVASKGKGTKLGAQAEKQLKTLGGT